MSAARLDSSPGRLHPFAQVVKRGGSGYVRDKVQELEGNRALVIDALSPLGSLGRGVSGGEGAIYLW